jgi:hypothetical protein
LLVEPGYHPQKTTPTLPTDGNGVITAATMKGRAIPAIALKNIHFSGYDWTVRYAEKSENKAFCVTTMKPFSFTCLAEYRWRQETPPTRLAEGQGESPPRAFNNTALSKDRFRYEIGTAHS